MLRVRLVGLGMLRGWSFGLSIGMAFAPCSVFALCTIFARVPHPFRGTFLFML
jgi:hypothetical protein